MTEEHITLEPFEYLTEKYDKEELAWHELGLYLNKYIAEGYWIIFRSPPEVNKEYRIDYQKNEYRGYVRFLVNPKKAWEDSNTFHIPSLGAE